MIATLLVAAVVLVAWPISARAAASKVEVSWAGSPRCTGTQVRDEEVADPPEPGGPIAPVIVARPAMSCVVEIEVANRGFADVVVKQVVLPFAGSGSQTVFEARASGAARPHDDAADDVDATYDLGLRVRRGETRTVRVVLAFRKSGCQAAGRFWAAGWPRVRMSALRRGFDRAADDGLFVRIPRDFRGDCFD